MSENLSASAKMEAIDNHNKISHLQGWIALSPLLLFLVLYVATSVVVGDFYKTPLTVAFMFSSMYAIAISKGSPLSKRIEHYSKGAGTSNLMYMLWIFVLAGAFANSAKMMGSVDATVNLALAFMPGQMILAGLFLIACFISFSVGTSVGTIVALMPMAVGIAEAAQCHLPLVAACVVGGAFFGDNLSFISDTTIAATTTQGCALKDKFKVNAFIVFPAALVVFVIYAVLGRSVQVPVEAQTIEWLKVLPYVAVLVTAVIGWHVMAILTLGIGLCGVIGILGGSYGIFGWFDAMGSGIMNMAELMIITMMAGGLLEIIRVNGGVQYIIERLSSRVNSRRGAEWAIGALVSLVNVCTANNTVAILAVGNIAKEIGTRFGVDPRKSASILDTFSCCIQGLLPYGAQLLLAAGIAKLNPIQMMPYLFYPIAIGCVTFCAILIGYPRRFSMHETAQAPIIPVPADALNPKG